MKRWSLALLLAWCVGCVGSVGRAQDAAYRAALDAVKTQADRVLDYVERKSDEEPSVGGEECAELRARHAEIETLRSIKCVGENNRGYVELREDHEEADAYFDTPDLKNSAQKLVAAENADRKRLYRAIAESHSDVSITLSRVERIIAARRLDRANPGDYCQLPRSSKDFDAFLASPMGQKLGDACKPGAWVEVL